MAAPRLTTRLRLTLIFTGISIGSVVVVFALTVFSLYRTLQQDDLRDMRNRLLVYWAQFQTGGIELLQTEIDVDNILFGERPFFVRIADRANRTLFFSYPGVWESFGIVQLDTLPLNPNTIHVLTSPGHDYELEVAGIWLADDYFLQLGLSTQDRTQLLGLFQRNFFLMAAAVVGIGFVVGLVTASRALRPISRVTTVARHIVDTGRLDGRVEQGTGGGELTQLVDVINAMLARIDRLVAGMRDTVDMVAHDLRTPITRLRARAELALRDGGDEEAHAALVETVEQSDEILRLVNTLLDITEAESGVMRLDPEPVHLATLLGEVRDLYELLAEERSITIRLDVTEEVVVEADWLRLRQVVANLVDNAVKYCREGGLVTISGGATADPDTGVSAVRIAVSDTGPGLDEAERERVWERMYRGPVQPTNSGLGLGLSLVRAVVLAHEGRAWVESGAGRGARFVVELPAVRRHISTSGVSV